MARTKVTRWDHIETPTDMRAMLHAGKEKNCVIALPAVPLYLEMSSSDKMTFCWMMLDPIDCYDRFNVHSSFRPVTRNSPRYNGSPPEIFESCSSQIDFLRIKAIKRRTFRISSENSFGRVCISYSRGYVIDYESTMQFKVLLAKLCFYWQPTRSDIETNE